jgi:hypothetical protein
MTVTSRFFSEKSREASRQIANPFPHPPPGRSPIARLHAHSPSPKLNWTSSDLADWISRCLPGAIFFPDTGIFTRDLGPAVWNALTKKRIPITPGVARELLPWLTNPFCNKEIRDSVLAASKAGFPSAPAGQFPPSGFGLFAPGRRFADHGYEYYVNLLALRKMMGPLATAALTKKLGREPTLEEFHAEVQSQLGERGYLLARKGIEAQDSPNKLTDEHLVVTATLTAIMSGSEVVIMTRDPDVLEQHAKLCTLMKEHYRATLAAELYAENPSVFAFEEVPLIEESLRARFSGESVLRLETSDAEFNPLSKRFHFVCIYCLLLGTAPENIKVTVSSFCAETEMAKALAMKASTGGLTTDKFNGRNCIILTEHLTPKRQKVIVLIGHEQKAKFGNFAPGVDDVHNTLTSNELSMRSRYDETVASVQTTR